MMAALKCDKHCKLHDSVNNLQVGRVIFHSSSCSCSCCVTLHFPPFCFFSCFFFVFVFCFFVICARYFNVRHFLFSSFVRHCFFVRFGSCLFLRVFACFFVIFCRHFHFCHFLFSGFFGCWVVHVFLRFFLCLFICRPFHFCHFLFSGFCFL